MKGQKISILDLRRENTVCDYLLFAMEINTQVNAIVNSIQKSQ